MRSLWILPDRKQSGYLQVIENGEMKHLSEALELSKLPRSLVLGIPEELLSKEAKNSQFIFAQYARNIGSPIFCLSMKCGLDKTGRTETLTNIQILEPDEKPKLPPPLFKSTDKKILDNFSELGDLLQPSSNEVRRKIERMLEAVKNLPRKNTFCSDRLQHSANKPDWMPTEDPSNSRNYSFFLIAGILIVALLSWSSSLP